MPLASAGDFRPEQDPFILKEWEDTNAVLKMQGFTEKYAVLKYVFSEQQNALCYILGNGNDLYFGKVTDEKENFISREKLLVLAERYRKRFVEDSNEADDSLHSEMAAGYFLIWQELYDLLLKPIARIRGRQPYKEVFYQCKIVIDCNYILFNLSLLYDVHFLYCKKTENEPLYFTHVSDECVADYFPTLLRLPCPTLKQMVLLNGNEALYAAIKDSDKYTREEKERVLVRETLFNRAMVFFETAGGQYMKLESIQQIEELLSVNSQKNVLQLFAHYHDKRLHTEKWHIRLKTMLSTFTKMKNEGRLRPDVIIDASTCNNFNDFKAFREAGIKYLYYRHQDITADIAVLIFLEMYSGWVAKQLKWDFPYLDGKTHMNIVYSKINRAFYIMMNLFNEIKRPSIMEKIIIAEGAGLSSFLDYVEDTYEAQEEAPEFKYQPNFDKGLGEDQAADLVSLILTGMGSSLGTLLINYFFRFYNNEITIKGKTEDGKEVSITMRNRTEDEVKTFLDKIGVKPENN